MACSCGKSSQPSSFKVEDPKGNITSWSTKAEQEAAIARTGGKAV